MRPYLEKYSTQERGSEVAQVVEHLPSKCEALSSDCQNKKSFIICKMEIVYICIIEL
jgi:hypothetical protein